MFSGSGEILDDIMRHGSHDVFWCYVYERMVSIYVNVKTNNKEDEISFLNHQRRLLFTWVFNLVQVEKDGLLPPQRLCKTFHEVLKAPQGYSVDKNCLHCPLWHASGLLQVSSIDKAKSLWKSASKLYTNFPCSSLMHEKGIVIGGKQKVIRETTTEEKMFLSQNFRRDISKIRIHKKLMYKGDIFRVGDNVVVSCDKELTPSLNVGHWKACIKLFFSIQHNGNFHLFFGADYYLQRVSVIEGQETLKIDEATGMSVLQNTFTPYKSDCIQPIQSLLHKFVPLQHNSHIAAYETQDLVLRTRLVQPGCVGCIPPWIEKDDIVLIKPNLDALCFPKDVKYAVVRDVDYAHKQVKVAWIGRVHAQERRWKIIREDDEWKDWWLCASFEEKWQVIKKRTLHIDGEARSIPTMWQS